MLKNVVVHICISLLLFFCGINFSKAQLTFNNGLSAQQLAQALSGPGITVSNAVFSCPTGGIGSFAGGATTNIGISSGIILTTGPNNIASGPNNEDGAGDCGSPPWPGDPQTGDPDLASLAGALTYDACKLEFDMTPLCDTMRFRYVFASEEYPEYVCSDYNDVFAFFISGPGITGQQNIALIPNTTIAVAINSVNSGSVGSNGTSIGCTSLGYSQYYVSNASGGTIQYDGFTTVLTAKAVVQACQTYHMKITIADAGDCLYDSGLLLEGGSLQCRSVTATATVPDAVEGCRNGVLNFCRSAADPFPLPISYSVGGTAINGTDYNTLSTTVTIPAGQSCVTLPIVPIADGVTESADTVLIIYQPGDCPVMDTVILTIGDSPTLNIGSDVGFCSGGSVTIGIPPVTGATYTWTPVTGLSDLNSSNPTVTLTNGGTFPVTSTYTLTVSLGGCSASDQIEITVNPPPSCNAGLDQTICTGAAVSLTGSLSGGATSSTWTGGTGIYNPSDTSVICTYTPSLSEITTGNVTLTLTTNDPTGSCTPASDQMELIINPAAMVSAGVNQTICTGSTVTLAGVIGGSASIGIWSGGTGSFTPGIAAADAVYTPSVAESLAGTVTLTYTTNDPSGPCPSRADQMVITINQLATCDAGASQSVCSGSGITLSGTLGGAASSGTWSGGSGTYSPNDTAMNAVYTPSIAEYAAGSVTLTLTTNDPVGSCSFASSNVTFGFYPKPKINCIVDAPAGCPIHCVNFTDQSSVTGGDNIVTWAWNLGDGTMSAVQNPSHCYAQTGIYDITLTAASNHGCVSSATIVQMIQVYALPVAGFNPTPNPATVIDPSVVLNNQSSSDVNYWHWNFGDGDTLAPFSSSPVHAFPNQASGSYWVTLLVQNPDGCFDTVAHEIFIGPEFAFYIPNAFSPNGDGKNDSFFGSGTGIAEYDLWIFDRWGENMFHGSNLNDKWNGKVHGRTEEVQQDVYVWKVKLADVFGKKHYYIGTVTLVK